MIVAIVLVPAPASKPAKFTHNATVEVIWTVIPAVILVAMAIPAAETLIKNGGHPRLRAHDQGHRLPVALAVRLHRRRRAILQHAGRARAIRRASSTRAWIRSASRTTSSTSTSTLVVPVDTKVRLLVTAADVLHAWWMPAFGVKKDAVPGFINEAWFTANTEGDLPRPVRGAMRHGPWIHADRRARGRAGPSTTPGYVAARARHRKDTGMSKRGS